MRNTDRWNLKGNDKDEVERRGGGVMVEKKGGGGVSTHAEEVECTGDAQCCRRGGRHTRELQLNNPKLQSEVSTQHLCTLS